MNSYYRLFLLFCLVLASSSCRKDLLSPAATQQLDAHTQDDLNRIIFVNDTLGFAAGGDKYFSSVLLRTTDGGLSWQPYTFTGSDSKAVYGLAYNGTGAYGVGYDGKIYHYNDAAGDWQRFQSPAWEWLQQIAFATPDKAFIVTGEGYRAGKLFRMDPAFNFSLVDTFEFQLADIQFPDNRTGYVSGYGAVLKTADGGDSWQLQHVKGDFFRAISCVGPDLVWIVGYNGTIIHTADGGQHWDKQRNGDNPLLKKYRLRAVYFKDSRTGYAAGDKGLVLKTTDGGAHWSEFERFTDNDIKCMTMHPDGSLWFGGANGTLFRMQE